MVSSADWISSATASATEYISRLEEYRETTSRLFPMLPKESVDAWSISEADALALGLFLERYAREVAVLDIGTFVGASAFFFASHPKVTRVISVDPNPTIADEINDKSEMLGLQIDSEQLRDLEVLDVARAVLAEFPGENKKVQLHAGTIGNIKIAVKGSSSGASQRLEPPMLELSGEESLVAFVDGLHTREGIQADLEAIFELNPRAVAILDDCRHTWGPFVQAGVVSFMEGAPQEYDFRLFGDLGPGIATSNLGIVYPRADGADAQRALAEFAELFTERLDLLRLLRREEELIGLVNRYKGTANEATRLQERNARLEEDNAEQRERNSELAERNSELTERNAELAERTSELIERNSDLSGRNTELIERNAHLMERNSELTERISELTDRISRLKEHNSRIKERSSQLEERGSGLEEQISRLEEHKARLEERNLELRKQNAQQKAQLAEQKAQLAVYRSSRRYRAADAVAERLRWVPDVSRRARRRPEQ